MQIRLQTINKKAENNKASAKGGNTKMPLNCVLKDEQDLTGGKGKTETNMRKSMETGKPNYFEQQYVCQTAYKDFSGGLVVKDPPGNAGTPF